MNNEKYNKAVSRNLAELQWAIIHRTTLLGIEKVDNAYSYFLHSTYNGLFNDYIAHCIKVFEQRKGCASFWYIYRSNKKPVDSFAQERSIDISFLESVSKKLKLIRDKTHFHIDIEGVLNTEEIWRQADLKGNELADAVDAAWKILKHLQVSLDLPEVNLPSYSETNAKVAAEEAERASNKP